MVPTRPIPLLLALFALFGAACSADPSWIPVESAESIGAEVVAEPVNKQASSDSASVASDDVVADDVVPETLAFVDEEPAASTEFCRATANIWIHSAALNLIGSESNPEMNQVALANVAEWLERATLFTEAGVTQRAVMFDAFTQLQATVAADFDHDWKTFQNSTAYANDPAAQSYETQRSELVPFINNECDLSIRDLSDDATARADEMLTEFASAPSTIIESDSLPGHSIFTHSSGRLIASFPAAWDHDEGRSDAIVDFIASPKLDRFLNGEAVDGVRIQLVDAATLSDFSDLIDATMIGSQCERTDQLLEDGATRLNITQTFECADHGASVIGQYNADRGLGLLIEASFDRLEPSSSDLIRLASIANSALWS